MQTTTKTRVQKSPIENKEFLNEAYDYPTRFLSCGACAWIWRTW